jgi:hypothetical protein
MCSGIPRAVDLSSLSIVKESAEPFVQCRIRELRFHFFWASSLNVSVPNSISPSSGSEDRQEAQETASIMIQMTVNVWKFGSSHSLAMGMQPECWSQTSSQILAQQAPKWVDRSDWLVSFEQSSFSLKERIMNFILFNLKRGCWVHDISRDCSLFYSNSTLAWSMTLFSRHSNLD